jgi:hypothetical protein
MTELWINAELSGYDLLEEPGHCVFSDHSTEADLCLKNTSAQTWIDLV